MTHDQSPTEAELVERAREGDEDAFRALCARYERGIEARLGRWMAGPLQRKVSVADVLQEARVTAHARLEDFEDRGEGAFGAWLSRIAELKAREAIRRYVVAEKRDVRREPSRGARPDTGKFRGHGPSPSEVAVARERADAVRDAMRALPGDYQEVLQLVRVEGMTLKDAALLMNRSHAATKKLYGRALSRLADLLALTRRERPDE